MLRSEEAAHDKRTHNSYVFHYRLSIMPVSPPRRTILVRDLVEKVSTALKDDSRWNCDKCRIGSISGMERFMTP